MPLLVRAGNGELLELVTIADLQAPADSSERENDLRTGDRRATQHRPGRGDLTVIHVTECPARHALTQVEFVPRMNVVRLSDIDRNDQASLRGVECRSSLGLAHVAPGVIRGLRLPVAV